MNIGHGPASYEPRFREPGAGEHECPEPSARWQAMTADEKADELKRALLEIDCAFAKEAIDAIVGIARHFAPRVPSFIPYRGWEIYPQSPGARTPTHFFIHEDFDGETDGRAGHATSLEDAKAQIDDIEADRAALENARAPAIGTAAAIDSIMTGKSFADCLAKARGESDA